MKLGFKQSLLGDHIAMNQYIRQFSLAAISLAVVQVANAQLAINSIAPMSLGAQGTEIRVMFNGLPPQPKAYQLDQPSRLVLDFDQTSSAVKQDSVPVVGNEVSSLQIASDAQRARVIVNLKNPGALTTRVEGNTFILKVNSATPMPEVKSVNSSKNVAVSTNNVAFGLSDLNFRRGGQDEGQIVVDLLNSNTPVDVQQQGSKVVVRLPGNKIPAALIRRLNVGEFSTPVSTVEAYNDGASGVVSIQTEGSYEYMAFQADKRLTVSLKRPDQNNPLKAKANQTYTGKKISLDFQDIEVRRVLQLLADFTGINMVTADSVSGNITLRLKDVPWDQALDIILRTKNLDKRRNGDVIWIAPIAEITKAEEEEARAQAQSVKMAALQTEYIQLSYAKATDIAQLIRSSGTTTGAAADSSNASSGGDGTTGSLLSSRGSLSIDARINTIIVTDTTQKIDQIRKMVDLLDVSVKQVLIEARIVRATTNFTKEMGVKWAVLSQGVLNNNNLLVGGSDTTLWNLREPDDQGKYTIERPQNLNVDLGVTATGASRIAFGLISLSDFMLDLELSALQADGYGEVISTPKVMTSDKQKAKVSSGTQIPYTSTSASGGGTTANTQFKDALLSLDVTPSITPDGKVMMQLNITSDSPGATTPDGNISINKNEINTNVLVNNGETVVLGGIFEQESNNSSTKVPFLGDIPYLGQLFRKDAKTDNKRELLIFVTPRIVNDSEVRNH